MRIEKVDDKVDTSLGFVQSVILLIELVAYQTVLEQLTPAIRGI